MTVAYNDPAHARHEAALGDLDEESVRMQIRQRREGSITTLELKGKLVGPPDSAPFESAMDRIVQEGHRFVALNCRGLDWVNSPGFGLIIHYGLTLSEADGELVLTDLNERVGRVVELLFSGPLQVRTFDSEAEARAHLNARAESSGT